THAIGSVSTFGGIDLDDIIADAGVLDNQGDPYTHVAAYGFFIDGDAVGLTGLFPDVFGDPQNGKPAPFCSQCDFFKWGATGAVVEFSNGPNSTQYVDTVGLGWWVAGDIPTVGQLPTLGSASYAGHTIGTVLQRVSTEGLPQWQSHIGAGNVELSWNFQARSGEFDIRNFNAPSSNIGPLNATGTLRLPDDLASTARNRFNGPISGTVGQIGDVSGGAFGSFARRGTDATAGVIGNWQAGNGSNYRATGIFGASRIGQ
ncbi:MAG: hypothetical protein ACAH19_04790, partial [Methyloceanibacter sp.]